MRVESEEEGEGYLCNNVQSTIEQNVHTFQISVNYITRMQKVHGFRNIRCDLELDAWREVLLHLQVLAQVGVQQLCHDDCVAADTEERRGEERVSDLKRRGRGGIIYFLS